MTESDLRLDDEHVLHVYDTGGDARLTVLWHHGTPNIGLPPEPLFATSDRLGVRWVSYDRPGYGGSTAQQGRDVASAARFASAVADSLGVERFAVMGHSGGGPHALATAALLPDRVVGVVTAATMAPFGASGLDWFAGMCTSGVAALSTAAQGRAAKEAYEGSGAEYDPEFTAADMAALGAEWSWFGKVVGPAEAAGPGPAIDDDLAYVAPWGADPAGVRVPALLLHGEADRIAPIAHSAWLAEHCPTAQLRRCAGDGHISVLTKADSALEWLVEHAGR